ncbi:hypothetical protein [Haloferax sp. DFSO52]|uniref:hypothetical protein n=1 Tax=Haloferax sp. DFSO52 TaxID=3388505 RepID=UPI003A8ABD4C
MGSRRREYFGDVFRAATASERHRFVADVWAARGWETTLEDSLVVARRATQTQRIAVVTGSRFGLRPTIPADADVVVALTPLSAPSARVISLDELYELVRYGLPAADGDRLVETHFGVSLDDVPASSSVHVPRADSTRSVLVVVAVVALLVVAIVATAGVPGVAPRFGGEPESDQSTATATPAPTPTPEPRVVAPGVTTDGIENASVLAAAHRNVVANESYQWTIGYRESIAGDETGREVEVVRVEEPHVYTSEVQHVSWSGLRAFPRPTASEDSYADGAFRYARRPAEPDGVAVRVLDPEVLDGPGRHAIRAERYIDWYLSTEQSRVADSAVVDGVVVYRIEGSGTDFPRSRDYAFTAFVEESGFVRSMQASYETRDGLGVTVWFEYDSVGTTTVEAPSWAESGNQTSGNRVTPAG